MEIPLETIESAFQACEALVESKKDLFLEEYTAFRKEYFDVFRDKTGLGERLAEVDGEFMRQLQSPEHRALYEDAIPTLRTLAEKGLRLGVISNATEGLVPLLLRMGVAPFFEVVVASWLVGYDKPQREIFDLALEGMDVPPEEAVHVGDSYFYDYLGASHAGLGAILLDRRGTAKWDVPRVSSLRELPAALGL